LRINKDLGAEKAFTVSSFQEKCERKGDCEWHPRLTGSVLLQAKCARVGQPSLELYASQNFLSLLASGMWITAGKLYHSGPGILLDEPHDLILQFAHRWSPPVTGDRAGFLNLALLVPRDFVTPRWLSEGKGLYTSGTLPPLRSDFEVAR
jgi:hypothetical protein